MSLTEALERLKDIRDERKLKTLAQAANHVVMMEYFFDQEFVQFCKRYLDKLEEDS